MILLFSLFGVALATAATAGFLYVARRPVLAAVAAGASVGSLALVASPVSDAVGDGVKDNVTGDDVADIQVVIYDNFIEHAPTVLALMTAVFTFFLGWRLLIYLIRKVNMFFGASTKAT